MFSAWLYPSGIRDMIFFKMTKRTFRKTDYFEASTPACGTLLSLSLSIEELIEVTERALKNLRLTRTGSLRHTCDEL